MSKFFIAIILSLIVFSYFSTNILSIIRLKDKKEQINIVPIERGIRVITPDETTMLTGDDIDIIVPWENFMNVEQNSEVEGKTVYKFDLVNLLVYNNTGNDPLTKLKQDKETMKMYQKFLGNYILNDSYLFQKTVLETTYNDIKWYNNRSKALYLLTNLRLKGKYLYHSYLYSYETDHIRGFMSDLANEKSVELNIFDNTNKNYKIYIAGDYNQEDIDFIIANIKIK